MSRSTYHNSLCQFVQSLEMNKICRPISPHSSRRRSHSASATKYKRPYTTRPRKLSMRLFADSELRSDPSETKMIEVMTHCQYRPPVDQQQPLDLRTKKDNSIRERKTNCQINTRLHDENNNNPADTKADMRCIHGSRTPDDHTKLTNNRADTLSSWEQDSDCDESVLVIVE